MEDADNIRRERRRFGRFQVALELSKWIRLIVSLAHQWLSDQGT